MVTFRTTVLFILLLAAAQLHAQTVISGGNVSGTWDASGNPYIIEGNISIDPEDRLSVKPGVEIFFSGNYSFEVNGRLDANGTEDGKIVFTLTDTTGFSMGAAGWAGIAFLGFNSTTTELSSLNHCIVEYSSGNGVTCLEYDNLEINHSEIRYNKNRGLALYEFSDVLIHGITLHHNGTGGMDAQFSSPQLSDFIIEYNDGPGISLFGSSYNVDNPLFENGIIRYNHTTYNGGGLQMNMDSFLSLSEVVIHNNSAAYGGGIYALWANLMLDNVEVRANHAVQGGGIYCGTESNLEMEFCLLAENVADEDGGGLWLNDADLEITRSTITGNVAGNTGGAMHYQVYYGQPALVSGSILWGNQPNEITADNNAPEVKYSDVAGGFEGVGNIDGDPLFESVETGNFHISWSEYPFANGSKSPCIDAGDPEEAWDADGTIADMGAYYYHQETITGINSKPAGSFNMFPNPASQNVTITGDQSIREVIVLNLAGQVVMQQEMNGPRCSFDISTMPSGLYVVQVNWNNGEVSTEKLIRE